MIIPANVDLPTTGTLPVANIANALRGNAYDYSAQRWVNADHVHVDLQSDGAWTVRNCGATLADCEPYVIANPATQRTPHRERVMPEWLRDYA